MIAVQMRFYWARTKLEREFDNDLALHSSRYEQICRTINPVSYVLPA